MNPDKKIIINGLLDRVNASPYLIVIDYTGLTVKQFTELRNRLDAGGARCTVAKNSYMRKVLTEAGLPSFATFADFGDGKVGFTTSSSSFKVKRILVQPGASLSLQMHHRRAEHWVVVNGTAEITCDDKKLLLTENESTYIPLGAVYRLTNPGTTPLEIIEVQSGDYLGEDDIVRFEDTYGRTIA